MSKHRKPDDAEVQDVTPAPAEARPSKLSGVFAERFLPHWGMLAIALFYVGFFVTVGAAGVPQPISLGFTGTLATWFGYLIQQSRKEKTE